MTTIDTTLYADGALRLARHGAGKGGTVLMLTATGDQVDIPDDMDRDVVAYVEGDIRLGVDPTTAFNLAKHYVEERTLRGRQVRFNRC